ncbi:MAG: TIGR00159 family protein [bacterium]|nr:TIGR00159 family protein [bacterium]
MNLEIIVHSLKQLNIIFFYIVDITIITIIFYQVFRLINNTRSLQMFRAILFFFVITMIAGFMNLSVTEWLFKSLWTVSLIVLVVVFQPEIRSILAEIGKRRLYNIKFSAYAKDEILKAVKHFSVLKIGALIVIERNTGLKEYIDNGIILNANLSSELLTNIFMPKSNLHDGAVIIQNNLVGSAASFLPLSKVELDMTIGTRHRAAIGMSELSDAFIIVVSEETGEISIAKESKVRWKISYEELESRLIKTYNSSDSYFKKLLMKYFRPQNFKKNYDEKAIALIVAGLIWYYIKFRLLAV